LEVDVRTVTVVKKVIDPIARNLRSLHMLTLLEEELCASGKDLEVLANRPEVTAGEAYGVICNTLKRVKLVTTKNIQPDGHKKLITELLQNEPSQQEKSLQQKKYEDLAQLERAKKHYPSLISMFKEAATASTLAHRRYRDQRLNGRNEKIRALYQRLYEENGITQLRDLINAPSGKERRWENVQLGKTQEQRNQVESHLRGLLENAADSPICDFEETDYTQLNPPSHEEVHTAITRLKGKAAPGGDDITPMMWKVIWRHCSGFVVRMIGEEWCRPESMPKEWSVMVMTLSPKDDTAAENPAELRTICMAQVILKVLTSILRDRLYTQALDRAVLPDEQFGFRPGRSSRNAFFGFRTEILRRQRSGIKAVVAFVDFEKAFDRVDRNILFNMMKKRGFSVELINILRSIYRQPTASVKMLPDVYIRILIGVLQGDPLSPLLFAIYIANMPDIVRFYDPSCSILLYADDLAIIADSEFHLNLGLICLSHCCRRLVITVNLNKCRVLIIERAGPSLGNSLPIRYEGQVLQQVSEFIYLGFPLDESMSTQLIYRLMDVKLLIQAGKLKRWWVARRDLLPFPVARSNVISLIGVREGQLLRELMGGSSRHPTVALYNDLELLPLHIQQNIQILTTRDRMQQYPIGSLRENAKIIVDAWRKWQC